MYLPGYEMQYFCMHMLKKGRCRTQRPFFFIFVPYLFLRKSGIWISFFCTALDGTFVPKEECIVGMVKVGIFRPLWVLPLPAVFDGLLTENGEVLLPPREDDGLEDASDNPVAITVILA